MQFDAAELLAQLYEATPALRPAEPPTTVPTPTSPERTDDALADYIDAGPDWWESGIEPPPPCPRCDTLAIWQNLLGDWHRERCNPPHPVTDRWWELSRRLKDSP